MGRKKILESEKNKILSVSILPTQEMFIQAHPQFDASKYVQLCLEQIMNLYEQFEEKSKRRLIL